MKGLEKLSLGPNSAGRSRSAECISSKRNSTSGRATEMSRSTSASASGSSGKSTSPTSVVEDDESYVGELELLMTLFPAV